MRQKITILLCIMLTSLLAGLPGAAQTSASTDTIFNPPVLYSTMPRTYEIAGIEVEGAPNYDDFLILGYAGLDRKSVV